MSFKRKCPIFAKDYVINTMARPIRNTPALYGKDAERFLAEISVLPSVEDRKLERQRIKRSVSDFLSLVSDHKGNA